ncbi:type IV pili methyl-accepting chemotaxis transducer N-terminal domain-containing protein [Actimicrobium sp. CCC2.4]|uniref:type IV pili methyl-accepting chemotaxis transducer N-terminal domain-containing protein n=1 Tax=Actimicrobium sp. CCC2.4 TaxID=3048606 RepID=UPI002AC8C989|nr:type IV pili methyl-accepting chemotaxis transducer N-terminal domain-containing protein [Actimicrobium sp. CCC2.4]MEB0135748.1 type IV pili methyl-accepting chemotaxis transducer N-terminal domain-containing protein [Actimicrobium sp. CCC2.4]WPX33232.1 type IV pili methyl-accepting chemotaxis transducer N-terminal domain-containing protein [Actimicrobium sp. CCC2.4]
MHYLDEHTPHFLRRRTMIAVYGMLLTGVGLSGIASAQSKIIPLPTIINRSGRLRALSQRMAKAYVQIALGVLPDKAYEILVSSQALIERNILDLRTASATSYPDALALLGPLDTQAKMLLGFTAQPASKENTLLVSTQADLLLVEAEKTTRFYEALAKSSQAKIVNIAGRQRMLSQLAAKSYLLIQAGHDTKAVRTDLQRARTEFKAGLDTMASAPISTVSIRQDLDLAKMQWGAFDTSLEQKPNATMSRNIATTSERLLELMDNLTNQYEQALKEMLGLSNSMPDNLAAIAVRYETY